MADLIDRGAVLSDINEEIEANQEYPEDKLIRKGLRIARKSIENAPTVNRWIPCSEQMPERFDTVLLAILSKNGYNEPAYYVTIGGLKNGKEFESYTGGMAEGEKVTHWMPLPNEPEVKENA